MLDKTLPPAGRALGSDTAQTGGRVMREGHCVAQLLDLLHPRHDDPVGANIQNAFDQTDIDLGDPYQHHRITSHCRANMLENIAPVQMAVLSVDNDPVEPQGDTHFGDTGRF